MNPADAPEPDGAPTQAPGIAHVRTGLHPPPR